MAQAPESKKGELKTNASLEGEFEVMASGANEQTRAEQVIIIGDGLVV